MNGRRLSLILCCAVALAACSSPGAQWSKATATNTIPAYQSFLSKYPNDVHAPDAKSRIAQLQDEEAWNQAQVASTAAGYQQYLTQEPNGAHAQAARDEISSRERADAWQAVQKNPTAQSLQAFLQKYPTGDQADQARQQLAQITGYRAELGTAHSEKSADRKRESLERRFGKDLQKVVVLEPDTSNHDYRITSAPMSKQDADAACASLKHEGQMCKVIQSAAG
ncbi:MAG TPA: hypothetical protein VME42_04570 [Steroidobacteraceae bacterium]|nr:hypothetical protein [Steroidobacteraceae bacterium]